MVGVFDVLMYFVRRRWREFAVRLALGARTADVLGLVAAAATRVIAIGAAVGFLLAVVLGQSLRAFLVGVEPLDPLTFGAVVLLVGLAAAAASAVPALR